MSCRVDPRRKGLRVQGEKKKKAKKERNVRHSRQLATTTIKQKEEII